LSIVTRSLDYWDNFYRNNKIEGESTFCFVKSALPGHMLVFDVGCGSGRDSFSFAKAGYPVVGIDRSEQAIRNNLELVERNGLAASIGFFRMDIGDRDQFGNMVQELSRRARLEQGRLLVYLRFVLHSIDETTQEKLLQCLHDGMDGEDVLAAEFRVKEDEFRPKVFSDHYRRYVDSDALVRELEENYRFRVDYYMKATGLSVFRDEDPYLARIIAAKI